STMSRSSSRIRSSEKANGAVEPAAQLDVERGLEQGSHEATFARPALASSLAAAASRYRLTWL
ncbi:MAG: hypothetical protein ACYS9X_26520, partial [Planctomycetota bacterium]